MQYLAVIDTNVLISALLTSNEQAATAVVVKKLYSGEIVPLYSEDTLREYAEVLSRPKFPFSPYNIHRLLSVIREYGVFVTPAASGEVLADMNDLPFYEIVLEKKDDGAYLVTGNGKHFPQKPFIVTPREMLDIIERNG